MYKQTSVVDPDPSSPYDLGLLDPDSDPLVRGTDPDPSQAKKVRKPLIPNVLRLLFDFYL